MEIFNIIAGVASILGLILSVIALFTSGHALKKVKKIDSHATENNIFNSAIHGDFTGRDRK